MKFAVVVVLVALALGVNSSVIPLGLHGGVIVGHPHSGISLSQSHLGHVVAAPGSVAVHAAALPAVHAVHDIHGLHGIHGVHGIHGLHGVVGSPVQIVTGPHVVPHVVPAVVPHVAATSVSKTRGAVHVAPLPGHTQSVVQANLAPAPGTW